LCFDDISTIRSLAGKLRIGLAEQSVLQALAHACVQTPLGQPYPPPIHTAYKSVDNEAFKEKLAGQSFKLKTAYCECPTYDVVVPALLEVCPNTSVADPHSFHPDPAF
jgi:DNA ligase-1